MIDRIVKAARDQNGWVVKGIFLTDQSKGVVMFDRPSHGPETSHGTATFFTTLIEDDPVGFEWGHYDMDESEAQTDFIARVERGY